MQIFFLSYHDIQQNFYYTSYIFKFYVNTQP